MANMSSSNLLASPQSTRPSFFRSLSSTSSSHALTSSVSFRKNKPRLYLALYPRGGPSSLSSYSSSMTCDSYHWALLIGPQAADRNNAGTCHQIIHAGGETLSACSAFYEETDLSEQSEAQSRTLLVRIALAKIVDESRLRALIRSLPQSVSSQSPSSDSGYDTDDGFATSTCLTWVKAAYKLLTCDSAKCLKSYIGPEDWSEIEECTRGYIKKKRARGRFGNTNGQGDAEAHRNWNEEEIPTWNYWENRETTP